MAYGNADMGDHPRACGEYVFREIIIFPNMGSPPRMRGILADYYGKSVSARITPAHAGNTRMPD